MRQQTVRPTMRQQTVRPTMRQQTVRRRQRGGDSEAENRLKLSGEASLHSHVHAVGVLFQQLDDEILFPVAVAGDSGS
jgi:hypothetical protein